MANFFSKQLKAMVTDLEDKGFGLGKDPQDVMKKLGKNDLKEIITAQWVVMQQLDERLKNAAIHFKAQQKA